MSDDNPGSPVSDDNNPLFALSSRWRSSSSEEGGRFGVGTGGFGAGEGDGGEEGNRDGGAAAGGGDGDGDLNTDGGTATQSPRSSNFGTATLSPRSSNFGETIGSSGSSCGSSGSSDSEDEDDTLSRGSSGSGSSGSSQGSSSINRFLDRVRTTRKTTRGNPLQQARCSASVSDNSGSNRRGRNGDSANASRISNGSRNSLPRFQFTIGNAGPGGVLLPGIGAGAGPGRQDPPEQSSPITFNQTPSPNQSRHPSVEGDEDEGEVTTLSLHSPRLDDQDTFLTEASSPRPHVRVTVTDTRVVPVVHSFSSLEDHTLDDDDDDSSTSSSSSSGSEYDEDTLLSDEDDVGMTFTAGDDTRDNTFISEQDTRGDTFLSEEDGVDVSNADALSGTLNGSGTLTSSTTILTKDTGEVETVEMKMVSVEHGAGDTAAAAAARAGGGPSYAAKPPPELEVEVPGPRLRGAGDASHGSDGDDHEGPGFLLSSQSSTLLDSGALASAEMSMDELEPPPPFGGIKSGDDSTAFDVDTPSSSIFPVAAALAKQVFSMSSNVDRKLNGAAEDEEGKVQRQYSIGEAPVPEETSTGILGEATTTSASATGTDDAGEEEQEKKNEEEEDQEGSSTPDVEESTGADISTLDTSLPSPAEDNTTITSPVSPATKETDDDNSNSITAKFDRTKLEILVPSPSKSVEQAELPGVVSAATPAHSSSQIGISQTASTPRNRVPGGAAAKLMLLGPRESKDELDGILGEQQRRGGSGDGDDVKPAPSAESSVPEDSLQEIERTMIQAREEFEKGNETNRRYHPQQIPPSSHPLSSSEQHQQHGEDVDIIDRDTDVGSNTPSFLNKNEIFHKTASAAIAALLTPRDTPLVSSIKSVHSGASATRLGAGIRSSQSGGSGSGPKHDIEQTLSSSSAFQLPEGSTAPVDKTDAAYTNSYGRSTVSESLLQPKTEKKLQALKKKMHDPTKTLTDLLTAIATPEGGLQAMDLGFMVRRKNACGALKVLTNDPRKRLRIAWTMGVLPALMSVLRDSAERGMFATFPDKRIRAEYEAARDRAIQTLLNLSMPKENRIPVFHTPDLLQSILAVIIDDQGVARRGCTAILAYLAKTVENRLLLAQIPTLYEALVAVLQPKPARLESANSPKPKKKKPQYPWSSDNSRSSEEVDSDDANGEAKKKTKNRHGEDEQPGSSEDSQGTPIIKPSKSPIEVIGYDETADEVLRASRQNVFALLGHLAKEKDNAYHFARDSPLLNTLIAISAYQESPSHCLAVKMIATMTRHRLNTKLMVFQERLTVPALVKAANSAADEARLYAVYGIQNMSQDRACRQELAMVDGLVVTLCKRGRYSAAAEERLSAISTLKNLCDEPANLIPLTNTPECIATLMHLAHGKEEGVTETMQYRACDALATLSHWLRKIATSGKSLDAIQRGMQPENKLFVPSLRVVTWNQWQ